MLKAIHVVIMNEAKKGTEDLKIFSALSSQALFVEGLTGVGLIEGGSSVVAYHR
jgi:hypothetical protein